MNSNTLIYRALNEGAPKVDLFPEDLQRELGSCETRISIPTGGWADNYFNQELFYKGKWRRLGHTSLFDDVATGFCAQTEEDTVTLSELLAHANYGARIHDDYISIITHMTDG